MKPIKKKHFEIFSREVKHLVKKWGLRDWKIYLECKPENGSRGRAYLEPQDHTATIRLSSEWSDRPTKKGLKFCARHEVLHVVIAYLVELAECRWCTDSEVRAEKERLVRHLHAIIFGKDHMFETIEPDA